MKVIWIIMFIKLAQSEIIELNVTCPRILVQDQAVIVTSHIWEYKVTYNLTGLDAIINEFRNINSNFTRTLAGITNLGQPMKAKTLKRISELSTLIEELDREISVLLNSYANSITSNPTVNYEISGHNEETLLLLDLREIESVAESQTKTNYDELTNAKMRAQYLIASIDKVQSTAQNVYERIQRLNNYIFTEIEVSTKDTILAKYLTQCHFKDLELGTDIAMSILNVPTIQYHKTEDLWIQVMTVICPKAEDYYTKYEAITENGKENTLYLKDNKYYLINQVNENPAVTTSKMKIYTHSLKMEQITEEYENPVIKFLLNYTNVETSCQKHKDLVLIPVNEQTYVYKSKRNVGTQIICPQETTNLQIKNQMILIKLDKQCYIEIESKGIRTPPYEIESFMESNSKYREGSLYIIREKKYTEKLTPSTLLSQIITEFQKGTFMEEATVIALGTLTGLAILVIALAICLILCIVGRKVILKIRRNGGCHVPDSSVLTFLWQY